MDASLLEPLPVDRRKAAQLALSTAFGERPVTGVQQIFGGVSAQTFRVDVAEHPYLLRMDARSALRNPERGYLCMEAASKAGIAPRLHHVDSAAGIAIMDFIAQRPLAEYPGGAASVVRDMGKLISKLQSLPAFPAVGNYLSIIERMLNYVRSSNMFAPGLLDPHAAAFEKIRKAYPWNEASLVPSHNDPNLRNILFDGARLWLIDWETSFLNDPLTDIAIIANESANTPELESTLLNSWLGREPDAMTRARLAVMRHLTRLYYAAIIFGLFARTPRTEPYESLQALSEAEFRQAVIEGRLKVGSPQVLYELGKMMLHGFMSGVSSPAFDEALVVVAS